MSYPDLSSVQRILIIKLRHLGDVLLTTPLFSLLKGRFPHAAIDAYVYKDALPILEGNPHMSECITCDPAWKALPWLRRWAKERAVLRTIRARRYDAVIQLTEGDRGAIAARASGAPIRVGCDPKGEGFLGKEKCYTHIIASPPQKRHCVERHLDAARCLGIFPEAHERGLYFHVPDEANARARALIGPGAFVLVHPVARWQFKHLSTQQIADLLRALHARGERIVLSSGPHPEDLAYIDAVLALVPDVPLCNVAGQLSVKELGALIAQAKALICIDSLPLHLASALKTPVVVLFGPTCDKKWAPWQHPKAQVVAMHYPCRPCLQAGCGGSKKSDCLLSLPVKDILDAYDRIH